MFLYPISQRAIKRVNEYLYSPLTQAQIGAYWEKIMSYLFCNVCDQIDPKLFGVSASDLKKIRRTLRVSRQEKKGEQRTGKRKNNATQTLLPFSIIFLWSTDTRRVEPFFVLLPMGEGGSGVVKRIVRTTDGAVFTVKISRDPMYEKQDAFNEYQLSQSFGPGTKLALMHREQQANEGSEQKFYLPMQWCHGDLYTVLIKKRLSGFRSEHIISLLYQAAQKLAALHRRGILHRDVKLDNYLVDIIDPLGRLNKIYLSDFGSAQEQGVNSSDLVGTQIFLAPELTIAADEMFCNELSTIGIPYSTHSDIYSLGLMFFGIVYVYQDNLELRQQFGLLKIIAAMTRYAPEERCSADEVINRLAQLFKMPKATVTVGELKCILACFDVAVVRHVLQSGDKKKYKRRYGYYNRAWVLDDIMRSQLSAEEQSEVRSDLRSARDNDSSSELLPEHGFFSGVSHMGKVRNDVLESFRFT